MKLTSDHLNSLLLAALVIILLIGGRNKQVQDRTGEIKALDKLVDEKQAHLETYRAWKDEEIKRGLERDSLLSLSYSKHQQIYPTIYETLKKIGPSVDRIADNDAELRAAYSRREPDDQP